MFAVKGDVNELEYLFSQPEVDKEAALALCESIKRGIFLLEEILNEFREFVKATQLDVQELDFNQVVKEAIDENFPKRSDTVLKLKLASDLPRIKADPKKLKRCFSELVENAINFQPDGGEIRVTTSRADAHARRWLKPSQRTSDFVQVRFEDNGPGIEQANKPRIFNPFYTSRAKGLGLGLSIVKGIIDAHKGVVFESGKPGKGAKFTILLPITTENG